MCQSQIIVIYDILPKIAFAFQLMPLLVDFRAYHATNTHFHFIFCHFGKALKNRHLKVKGIIRAPLLELVLDGVLLAVSVNTLHLALLFQLPPHLVIFLTPCVKL